MEAPASDALAHLAAALERLRQRDFVGILEVATHGQATRDARDAHTQRLEQLGQIDGRGLALNARIGGEDDLFDPLGLEPRQQLPHAEVFGADAVQRRERAQQHVIATAELPCPLEREQVIRLLDDAERPGIALGVATDAAGILLGHVEAYRAVDDELLELDEGFGQRRHLGGGTLEEKEGQALGRLGPDAGQPLERVDEPRNRLGIIGHYELGGGDRRSSPRPPHRFDPMGLRFALARDDSPLVTPLHPEAGDLEPAGQLGHLRLHHLAGFPPRFIAGGHHQVFEHLRVIGIDHFAVDLDREDLLLPIGLDRDHSAASRGLHFLRCDGGLELLHLGLQLLRLLHDIAEAFNCDSPSSGTVGRTATTSPWNTLKAACTAGWLRAALVALPAPLPRPASTSKRRAPGTWCWTAWLIRSRLARSASISAWKALAVSPTFSTPPATSIGEACWSTEPSRAFLRMISATTRCQASPSSAATSAGLSVGPALSGAASAAGGPGLLPPETVGARGGAAGRGASSKLSWTTVGRPAAPPDGIARSRASASSSLARSVSNAWGSGRRVVRTAAISSSTRGCGERRISASASRNARKR